MTHEIHRTACDVFCDPLYPGSSPLPTASPELCLGNAEVKVTCGRRHEPGQAFDQSKTVQESEYCGVRLSAHGRAVTGPDPTVGIRRLFHATKETVGRLQSGD